jgi:hemoglobin
MQTEKQTLYEKLGGEPAIQKAVEVLYGKVLIDPELMGFFTETDMAFQKKHVREFFTFLTGGSEKYPGKNMREAHKHLKLTDEHMDIVKRYFGETLSELGVSEEDTKVVVDQIESFRDEALNR